MHLGKQKTSKFNGTDKEKQKEIFEKQCKKHLTKSTIISFIINQFHILVYLSIFSFTAFLQITRFKLKFDKHQWLLISLSIVMLARSLALISSIIKISQNNSNNKKKYDKLNAYNYMITSIQCIAVIIQVFALLDNTLVNDKSQPVHMKGAMDFIIFGCKFFLLIYLLNYRYEQYSETKKINNKNATKTRYILFWATIVLVIFEVIAFFGKIINVLEQTERFNLFSKGIADENNPTPNIFPLGLCIRIACLASIFCISIYIFFKDLDAKTYSAIEKDNCYGILKGDVNDLYRHRYRYRSRSFSYMPTNFFYPDFYFSISSIEQPQPNQNKELPLYPKLLPYGKWY